MYQCLFILSVILSGISSAKECTSSVDPPDPKSGCCGLANGNSLKKNTSTAEIDEYPWMALIEFKKQDRITLLCSAILISGRYALTSAKCFSKPALKLGGTPNNLRIGEYETTNEGKDCVEVEPGQKVCNDGALSVPIEKITTHPVNNFNTFKRNDNIALIRLSRTVPYTDFIRPICLPSLDITLQPIQPSKKLYMTVAGWGAINHTASKSNVLRRVHVPYVDLQICQSKYDTQKLRVNLTNSQLCAGSKNRDACKGDSGGPLMYFNRHTIELAGIVSFGPVLCGSDIPGVYTKVFAYKDWIRSVIEEDSKILSPTSTTFDTDMIYFRE